MRSDDRSDYVVGSAHVGDPVANRLGGRVLQCPGADGYLAHLRVQQLHPANVHRLPAHVLGAHVDGALEAEPRRNRSDSDAVLARSGFGYQARLAHAQREQRLPQRVVELVRARVAEILTLQVDVPAAEMLSKTRRRIQRCRPPHERMPVAGQLQLKLRVGLRLVPHALELFEGAHQRLRDVLPAERPEPPAHGMAHPISAARTASMKARTLSGSFTRTADSTPLDTSTPWGLYLLTTVPTLPGSSPPATKTLRRLMRSRASSQAHVRPVPPRWSRDHESSISGSGHALASGTSSPLTLSTFISGRPASKPGASEPCSCSRSRPTCSAIWRTSSEGWSMNTPTIVGRRSSPSTIDLAASGSMRRDDEQKWKPSRSAPASTASCASPALQMPQIFTWTISRRRLGAR